MAHPKISKHHHTGIADYRIAIGLLVIKRSVDHKDHIGGNYYHAIGTAAIGIGLLFATGF